MKNANKSLPVEAYKLLCGADGPLDPVAVIGLDCIFCGSGDDLLIAVYEPLAPWLVLDELPPDGRPQLIEFHMCRGCNATLVDSDEPRLMRGLESLARERKA